MLTTIPQPQPAQADPGEERLTIHEWAERIGHNAWNWDYRAFCRKLDLDPETQEDRQRAEFLWKQFVALSDAMRKFGECTLETIFSA